MKHKPPYTLFTQKIIALIAITVMLPDLLTACVSPRDSIYEGLLSTSFEVSVFYPCSMSAPTEYVEGVGYKETGYWLISTPDSGFNEQLKTFHSYREPTGQLNMYVKIVGTVSPTKEFGYGHLGMYSNQITVKEVLDMKPWVDNQCQLEA